MKLLLWAALIACVIWVLRSKSSAAHAGSATRATRSVIKGESMVACTYCGLHFPSSEAITDASGAVFCGDEHRRLHASR